MGRTGTADVNVVAPDLARPAIRMPPGSRPFPLVVELFRCLRRRGRVRTSPQLGHAAEQLSPKGVVAVADVDCGFSPSGVPFSRLN